MGVLCTKVKRAASSAATKIAEQIITVIEEEIRVESEPRKENKLSKEDKDADEKK